MQRLKKIPLNTLEAVRGRYRLVTFMLIKCNQTLSLDFMLNLGKNVRELQQTFKLYLTPCVLLVEFFLILDASKQSWVTLVVSSHTVGCRLYTL